MLQVGFPLSNSCEHSAQWLQDYDLMCSVQNDLGTDGAEQFFHFVAKMNELDLQNGENGSSIDEMKAHMFLEHFHETMTVREVRPRCDAIHVVIRVPGYHYLVARHDLAVLNVFQVIPCAQGLCCSVRAMCPTRHPDRCIRCVISCVNLVPLPAARSRYR